MTGYGDAYKFDILMQWPSAIAIAMMGSERKPPSMLKSQDNTNPLNGDFTEITVSNPGNGLHLVRVNSARLDGRMLDILEVAIWRTVSR